jgi:hypothetical protein
MVYLIDKNRNGEGGTMFWTRFKPNEGKFEEISKASAEDLRDAESVG